MAESKAVRGKDRSGNDEDAGTTTCTMYWCKFPVVVARNIAKNVTLLSVILRQDAAIAMTARLGCIES
mgnify:FL=1